jgi:hypothetical protein
LINKYVNKKENYKWETNPWIAKVKNWKTWWQCETLEEINWNDACNRMLKVAIERIDGSSLRWSTKPCNDRMTTAYLGRLSWGSDGAVEVGGILPWSFFSGSLHYYSRRWIVTWEWFVHFNFFISFLFLFNKFLYFLLTRKDSAWGQN